MNTLIIIGHPKKDSLSHSIANSIIEGTEDQQKIKKIDLAKVDNYKINHNDVLSAQEKISWAEKIIFIFPIWWSLYPAILKGFIDDVFLPDFAFKYEKGKIFPQGLLKGKSAHIISTSDSPNFYRRFILGDPATKALKRDTLGFCGIKDVKVTRIASIRDKSQKEIGMDLMKIKKLFI